MAEVRLDTIRKDFGAQVAVRDLDLTVKDQEFLTLIGPSGCGKTTTLRMICGLEKTTGGEIYFDDKPVSHLPANRRDVAMVFQSYALYPHMTVTENIGFALTNMGVPKREIAAKVTSVARLLGIEHLLARKPKELSGGQRQRVALGRALVRDAEAYLLDEPLSNLDAKLRVQMRAEIKKLHADLLRTFIYVTHDQVEAMTMSDRIAVLDEGVLQQCAAPMEIYSRPANLFVAGFMGSPPMNFLNGRLTRNGDGLRFEAKGLSQPVGPAQEAAIDGRGERPVVLGIRPEDVKMSLAPSPGFDPAKVFVEEPMGADVLVTLEVGDDLVKARVEAPFSAGTGNPVQVRLQPERLYFFDAESGNLLAAPPAKEVRARAV
ncbi:MAG: ABC transporter ATP-binding protein [Candidatus Dormibacteraeota bacterium]|nr:ABC transporter ATP-binding protein [Candidatus Dormibacteraeota bacterium]